MRNYPLEVHPLAELFPQMMDKEFQSLVCDIREHGLREPIVTLDGLILDGRHRYRACMEAGIDPDFRELGDTDPIAFVVSVNLHRRQLTKSQLSVIAARLADMRQGERTDLEPSAKLQKVSRADAANLLGVSERSVADAVGVLEQCAPDVADMVTAGHFPSR